MSDKTRQYSLSRAITETLTHGAPRTGLESELHYQEARARESGSKLSFLASANRGGGNILHAPLWAFRDLTAGPLPPISGGAPTSGGGNLVGLRLERYSDLLSWSAAIAAGATQLSGLRENVSLARVTALPEPDWIPEIGFAPVTDPAFDSVLLGPPKRVCGLVRVSRQLLIQAGPDLDAFLTNDLSRACSSQLDRMIFYGDPATNPDQPLGIVNTPGIWRLDIGTNVASWETFTTGEGLIELQNIGLGSYGLVTNPTVKKALADRPMFAAGAGRSIWEGLPNAHSSNSIAQNHIFFGEWKMLVIGIWSDSVDVVVNPYTLSHLGQVDIVVNLFTNFVLRAPEFFGVMDITVDSIVPPTPPPLSRQTQAPQFPPPPKPALPSPEPELASAQAPGNEARANSGPRPGKMRIGNPFK
jgi:Phage capsid family